MATCASQSTACRLTGEMRCRKRYISLSTVCAIPLQVFHALAVHPSFWDVYCCPAGLGCITARAKLDLQFTRGSLGKPRQRTHRRPRGTAFHAGNGRL